MKKIKILSVLLLFFVVSSNFAITFYISNYTPYPVQFYAYTPKKYIGSGRLELIAPGKTTRLLDAGVTSSITIHWQMERKEYQKEINIIGSHKMRVSKEFAILKDGAFEHNLIGGSKRYAGQVPGYVIPAR